MHIQAALIALIVVGTYGLWIGIQAYYDSNTLQSRKISSTPFVLTSIQITKIAASCVPVVILIGLFFKQNGSQLTSRPHYVGLLAKLTHIFFLSGVANYSVFGLGVSAGLFCAIIFLIVVSIKVRRRDFFLQPQDCLFLCSALIGTLFFVMPDGIGDAFNIEERIMIPLLFVIITWLAIEIGNMPRQKEILFAVLSFLLLQTIDRYLAFRTINGKLEEFNYQSRFWTRHAGAARAVYVPTFCRTNPVQSLCKFSWHSYG
jgi:hypothetical protein